jgi:hypothetical protein
MTAQQQRENKNNDDPKKKRKKSNNKPIQPKLKRVRAKSQHSSKANQT